MSNSKSPLRSPLEADVTPQIVQAFEASGCILWRNNIGCYRRGAHWIRYGVGGKGGSDFIGFLPVRITQAMVGQLVAVVVAPEAKRPLHGVPSAEQAAFVKAIKAAGGISGFVHSWEEARALITNWYARFS